MPHNPSVYASGQSLRIVAKYGLLMAYTAGTRNHEMPASQFEGALTIENYGRAV
jgi:hypothetical protein